MRRSSSDLRMGRALLIGEPWRNTETGVTWRIYQIHLADCHVELKDGAGGHICIRLAELRRNYHQTDTAHLEAA